jgi:hypothetical protein
LTVPGFELRSTLLHNPCPQPFFALVIFVIVSHAFSLGQP